MAVEYKDYYQILGISRTASESEIKSAYRKLARQYHPDVNPGGTDKFKEIGEAYEALKDPEKRKLYDNLGSNWRQGQNFTPPPGYGGGGGWQNVNMGGGASDMGDFSSFFDILFGGGAGGMGGGMGGFPGGFGGGGAADIFGAGGGDRQAGRGSRQQTPAPEPQVQSLPVDLELVAKGGRMDVQTPSGKRLNVNIPKGVKEGAKIRLAGEGTKTRQGASDLLLQIQYKAHKHFKIEREHLVYDAPVAVADLVLGAEISIPAFSGDVTMSLPPGTQSDRLMRLKGQGLPDQKGQPGDLLVRPRAIIPKTISAEEKELYQKLRSLSHA
jgi:curved DNA-binding protein